VDRTEWIFVAVAGAAVVIAATTDLWRFKVYNALTFPTLVAGLAASAWVGGWWGLADGVSGALLGFGLLLVPFVMGGVGAGDVKLLTALGAWLGPWLTLHVFLASAVAAGLYALALSALGSGLASTFVDLLFLIHRVRAGDLRASSGASIHEEAARPDRRRRLVPFAAMTCLGFFVTVFWWKAPPDDGPLPRDPAPTVASASLFEGATP